MIAKAAKLANRPNAGIAKGMGFESVLDAKIKLIQDLLLSEQQLKDMIETLNMNNTPSTTNSYLELKHLSHSAQLARINLNTVA